MPVLHVAAAQYPIDDLADIAAFEMKLSRWVAEAVGEGAELLVFPEYGTMELASIARDKGSGPAAVMAAIQPFLREGDALHSVLARRHHVHILAASAPVRQTDGRFVNTARFFSPTGAAVQEKLIMTPQEREILGVSPGRGLRVFETTFGTVGVAICYDAEFPIIPRALAAAGAQVLLVPACCDTLAGYHRIRTAAAARALENQCFTVVAPALGRTPWSSGSTNVGAAGMFAPPDRGFPPDGVIANGDLNRARWLHAQLDLDLVAEVRSRGEVLNFKHWDEQPGLVNVAPAEVVKLH
ncbi:MAG TPA: carbon-nitrogen hydrolase family protein [Xanthobacteraceae bacterium]|nr:carbon-nitrogen hydrolase family protein [Xanthobacteraceae bacterium]